MTTNYQISGSALEDNLLRRDLFSQGGLWLCGHNSYGQLGDSTLTQRISPIQTITGGTNWKQVACGVVHTEAVTSGTDPTYFIS